MKKLLGDQTCKALLILRQEKDVYSLLTCHIYSWTMSPNQYCVISDSVYNEFSPVLLPPCLYSWVLPPVFLFSGPSHSAVPAGRTLLTLAGQPLQGCDHTYIHHHQGGHQANNNQGIIKWNMGIIWNYIYYRTWHIEKASRLRTCQLQLSLAIIRWFAIDLPLKRTEETK